MVGENKRPTYNKTLNFRHSTHTKKREKIKRARAYEYTTHYALLSGGTIITIASVLRTTHGLGTSFIFIRATRIPKHVNWPLAPYMTEYATNTYFLSRVQWTVG